MVIAPIDQRDVYWRAGKPKRRFQSAEAGADDHHAMGFCRPRLLSRHLMRPWFWISPCVDGCRRLPVAVQVRFAKGSIAKTYPELSLIRRRCQRCRAD